MQYAYSNMFLYQILLVKLFDMICKIEMPTYQLMQIPSILITGKTHLRNLFDKTIFNDAKELYYPLFMRLFD